MKSTVKRYNILLLMTDQHRADICGSWGDPVVKTPTIDALATGGTLFENTYTTCPVCVPARASLLSGNYCANTAVWDNGGILASDEPTHNDYLNIAGYDTALIGKAHYIGPDQMHGFRKRPMTNFFPTNLNWMSERTDDTLSSENLHPNPIAVDYLAENVGGRQWSMQGDFDEEVVMQAIRYLATKRSRPSATAQKPQPPRDESPFFLQVSFNTPHEPFHPPQEFWDLYEGVDIPIPEITNEILTGINTIDKDLHRLHGTDKVDITSMENLKALRRAYYAQVSYADSLCSRVLDSLDRFGLVDNTIVIYISDHGDMLGDKGMIQKRVFYEGSVHIPLIVRYPEGHPLRSPGTRITTPASITDVAPTLLEMAGITDWIPMDGSPLTSFMTGTEEAGRAVFCENYAEGVTKPGIMVRTGKYKFTKVLRGERQLFDINDDPDERKNLAGLPEYAAIESELETLIDAKFDLEDLDRRADLSYRKRIIVRDSSMRPGAPSWNYKPVVDVDRMFWRNEVE